MANTQTLRRHFVPVHSSTMIVHCTTIPVRAAATMQSIPARWEVGVK